MMADITPGETTPMPEGLEDFVNQQQAPEVAPEGDRSLAGTPPPPGLQEFIQPQLDEEQYGTPTEIAKTAAEGIAKGVAGPLATGLETSLFDNAKEQRLRQTVNPFTHGAGEFAGLVGGALALPEASLGGALAKAGAAVKAAPAIATLGKIGSGVAAAAVEGALFQASDEASKLIQQDPNQSAETALTDIGLSAALNAPLGLVSPLWNATLGRKLGGILGATADKLGGIEGIAPEAFEQSITRSGLDMDPSLRGLVAQDPEIQQAARELSQTDTSKAGREYQERFTNFRNKLGESAAGALGKTPEEVAALGDLDKYGSGKEIGETLAKEYHEQVSPLAKGFEDLKSKFKGVDLPEAVVSNSGETVQPSLVDNIASKVLKTATDEGWAASPSSDIMRLVNTTVKELPLQKNLKNLSDYITQIGNTANSNPLNGPLIRAGSMIKNILKESEADVMALRLGEKEGPAAVEAFKQLRSDYAKQSALKDALDARLNLRASTSGYGKAIREFAKTDGEAVLRKLSGKNDADLLNFMQEHYPVTASAIRNSHIDELLTNAANKAQPGSLINTSSLIASLDKMSPQMKQFISTPEGLAKIKAVGDVLEHFKNPNHNFSNTARVASALLKDIPGTAVGAIGAITGHGFIKSALLGGLTKAIGKDIPDAIKLSMLKWLGSPKEINPGAFKSMVHYIDATRKGENLTSKTISNLFNGLPKVLPEHVYPSERDRSKIVDKIDDYYENPDKLTNIAGNIGHYMPDHAVAISKSVGNAMEYLRTNKPNPQPQNPLDTKRAPTPSEKANYNRKLDIAQQPLMVLQHIASGTLTADDVNIQKTLYPSLYTRISNKMTDEIAKAQSKGKIIPYKARMGLSMYLGQPMDSTMTPQAIISAQPKPPQSQPQTATQPASRPKTSTNSLNKMPKMYQTPGQSAEKDRAGRNEQ